MSGLKSDSGYLDAFLALATRDAIIRVGDGCRIWGMTEGREFRLLAADHRDFAIRDAAAGKIGSTIRWPRGAWMLQALAAGAVVNPPLLEDKSRTDLGLDQEEPIGDVLVVPVRPLDCVIVATRDRLNGRYHQTDRIRLQGIAAQAARHAGAELEHLDPARRLEHSEYLELASAAVWTVDSRGITTYVNRAASELVGLPASLIEGVPMSEFMTPDRADSETGLPYETDQPLLRADGSMRWTCVRTSLMDDGAALHTLYDVTDRRQRTVDLRVRLDMERSLSRLATFLLASPEPDEIFQRAVDAIAEQFRSSMVAVASISRDFGFGRNLAIAGTGEVGGWVGREGPVREPSRSALESNEVLMVGDFAEQTELRRSETVTKVGIQSGVIVPIAGGRGSIAVLSEDRNGVHELEREMLERIAEILGPCWERSPSPPRSRSDRL